MPAHRISLSDEDLELIVSALEARIAAVSPKRRARLQYLANRLSDIQPGNPRRRFASSADLELERQENGK